MTTVEVRKPHHLKLSTKQKNAFRLIFPGKKKTQFTDILLDGGARGGKTFVICLALVFIALNPAWAGIRILIAREKYNHAVLSIWKQTLIPMIQKYFRGLFKIDESYKILTSPWGSEIWLGGLDDKDRTDKIFGQEFAIIFLNEVVQISEATLDKVQTRMAQKIEGFINFMIMDCNPRSPAHYIYRKFYREKDKTRKKITFTPYDNLDNISETLIDRLKKLKGTERRRFLDGEWCEVEGTVYENIHEEHKIRARKDWAIFDYVVGGIDWGYHAAVVVWGVKEDKAVCLFEASLIGGKTNQVLRALKKMPYWVKKQVVFYADHEPDRIDELVLAGYNVVKADKDVSSGDGTVNDYSLYFDVECKETFQSMLNLMRAQDKEGNYTDRHVKVNDHEADASRYALHSSRMERLGEGGGSHFLKKRPI